MQFARSRDKIKYLEYVAIDDNRITEICKKLDGTRLPPDDPFWASHTPPNHFNCRSTVRAIFKGTDEAKRVKKRKPKDVPPIPEGFDASPLESWWKVAKSMKERLEKYGRAEEIKKKVQPLAIRDKEMEIVDLPKERAVLFDDWGDVIFEKEGTERQVDLSEIYFMARNKVLTHNHPGGGSLSPADIALMIRVRLREIRAVGREVGYVYRAWIVGEPSWSEVEKFVRFYESKHTADNELFAKAAKLYRELIKKGISPEKAQKIAHASHTHWIMEEASRKFTWLKYKREAR